MTIFEIHLSRAYGKTFALPPDPIAVEGDNAEVSACGAVTVTKEGVLAYALAPGHWDFVQRASEEGA